MLLNKVEIEKYLSKKGFKGKVFIQGQCFVFRFLWILVGGDVWYLTKVKNIHLKINKSIKILIKHKIKTISTIKHKFDKR